jgi:hypothetical protein
MSDIAAVLLWWLADELAAASADSFPLTGPFSPGQPLGCGDGPQAMVEADFR